MSSILKELRKLENEASGKEERKFPVFTGASKKAVYSRDKKVLWIGVYLPVFCSALILAVVGWAVFYNKPKTPPPPTPAQPLSAQSQSAPSKTGQPLPVQPVAPPGVASSPLPKEAPLKKKEEMRLPDKKESEGKNPPEESAEIASKPSPKPEAETKSSNPPQKEDMDTLAAQETLPEEKPSPAAETHSPDLDPVDDSWLKLQAISWSEDPKNRIAVINNQIVREGGSVDEGQIFRIEREFIVVEGKGKKWRLEFRLNQ